MSYLKVNTNFSEILEPLQDAEVGRLFRAMLSYAENGTVPEFKGNERFVWNAAKQSIDREAEISVKRSNNRKQTITNDNKTQQTATNGSKEKEPKRNIDIYINTLNHSNDSSDLSIVNNQETKEPNNTTVLNSFDTFWLAYPKKVAKKDAQRAWMKIKPSQELLTTMLEAIEQQKQSKTWREGYVPNPATWLNGERWNDVVKPTDRLAHLREMYEQEVAKDDSAGYGSDVCGHSNAVSPGSGFFDFIKTDG